MKNFKLILSIFVFNCLFVQTNWAGQDVNSDKIIEDLAATIKVSPPNPINPIKIGADVYPKIAKAGDIVTLIIRGKTQPKWYIYGYVPEGASYIQSKLNLKLPTGIEAVEDWRLPKGESHKRNEEIKIWQGDFYFSRQFRINENASGRLTLSGDLFYQCCNPRRCKNPTRQLFEVNVDITP